MTCHASMVGRRRGRPQDFERHCIGIVRPRHRPAAHDDRHCHAVLQGHVLGRGERVCLVGANGSGKSTILKALAGEIELDRGERFAQPGIRIGYLPQNADLGRSGSVAEYVAAGGRDLAPDDYRVATLLDQLGLMPGAEEAATPEA